MAINVEVFTATSDDVAHPTVSVEVPDEYKLLGGGAFDQWTDNPDPQGNLLTASYPVSTTRWAVAGKDHEKASTSRITAYALALYDPNDEWETIIASASSGLASHPSATAVLPPPFIMTGGGAFAEWTSEGSLLTASDPSATHTWQAQSKDHDRPEQAIIWSFAIGLRRRDRGPNLERMVAVGSGPIAAHPEASVNLPDGWTLVGGGAIDNWFGAGNLLTASYPQGNAWLAAGKDHMQSSPANISVYAIGVR
jgi:vibriolysin